MMRTGLVIVISLALLLVGCVIYPGIDARFIAPQAVLQAFLHSDSQSFDHNVIVRLRLPCLAVISLTGASLGVADALLQVVIYSPLEEPHILGPNARATLAVVTVSVLGLAFPVECPLLAPTGGVLLFLLILLLSSTGRSRLAPMRITLCGAALPALVSSIMAAILILDEQALLAVRTWLIGDLARQGWVTLGTSAWLSLGGFALVPYLAPSFNMLALGNHMVQGSGVSILRTRTLALLAIALLCGTAVSTADPIGFVGLLVPQIVRRLASADLHVLLPLSAYVGVLLLLLVDIIARTLFTPHELTTGIMTMLVDAPAFVIMATRMSKQVR